MVINYTKLSINTESAEGHNASVNLKRKKIKVSASQTQNFLLLHVG